MRGGYPDYNNMAGPHGPPPPHMRMGSQFHPGSGDPNMPPHQQQVKVTQPMQFCMYISYLYVYHEV